MTVFGCDCSTWKRRRAETRGPRLTPPPSAGRLGSVWASYFQIRLAPPARTSATTLDPTNAARRTTFFMLTSRDQRIRPSRNAPWAAELDPLSS
jgi:hypothetical protein